jgi:proteasome assembly chaperone (PAC2) family protein
MGYLYPLLLTDNKIAQDKVEYFNWEEVNNGVPQGSILGSLFLLLYINALHNIPTVCGLWVTVG